MYIVDMKSFAVVIFLGNIVDWTLRESVVITYYLFLDSHLLRFCDISKYINHMFLGGKRKIDL